MTESDARCLDAREVIERYQAGQTDKFPLALALEGMILIEAGILGNAAAEEAARHVSECALCTEWLDVFYPDRAAHRERTQKYCCGLMFGAVNMKEEEIRFSFEVFRGEDPCWRINDVWTYANFCPWCGKPLPAGPFE